MDLNSCGYCRLVGRLLRCSRCKRAYYCCKEHQTLDWKNHRIQCSDDSKSDVNILSNSFPLKPQVTVMPGGRKLKHSNMEKQVLSSQDADIRSTSPITYVGSSEKEIISARAEELDPIVDCLEAWMNKSGNEVAPDSFNDVSFNSKHFSNQYILGVEDKYSHNFRDFAEVKLDIAQSLPLFQNHNDSIELDIVERLSNNLIEDMDAYGVCVINDFLGQERGSGILNEVINMYKTGVFKDGQLVSNKVKEDLKTIRGDQITWIDGKEAHCSNIGMLIRVVDAIVMRANTVPNNGKMSAYTINGRTKAMVACYPGHGSHYVKHVDNPNGDGRCITAIYYLNADWDINKNGGLLRIFPEGHQKVADIEPIFDRILFFWSDRRNPHEVQPAYETRYAITLWYFDAEEREDACRRYQRENQRAACSSLANSHLLANFRNRHELT